MPAVEVAPKPVVIKITKASGGLDNVIIEHSVLKRCVTELRCAIDDHPEISHDPTRIHDYISGVADKLRSYL